mgnify:CR=1 FL=1
MFEPMRTPSLLDTDQNSFVCGRFSLPSDIHRSIIYAYHRKYPETCFTSAISADEYLNPIFNSVRRDIFGLNTCIMFMC